MAVVASSKFSSGTGRTSSGGNGMAGLTTIPGLTMAIGYVANVSTVGTDIGTGSSKLHC